MRASLVAVSLSGLVSGCGEAVPAQVLVRVPVDRVVEVQMNAVRDSGGLAAEEITAAAWIRTGVRHEAEALAPGQCEREDEVSTPRGAWAGGEVALDFGDRLTLGWEPAAGAYLGSFEEGARDLAWQPVALVAPGTGAWQLHAAGALRFGDAPTVLHATSRPDGSQVVWWEGDYDFSEVEAIVATKAGRWHCGSGRDHVVVPWWLGEDSTVYLAATRTHQRLLEDHTLVVGRATILVPAGLGYMAGHVVEDEPMRPSDEGVGRDRRNLERTRRRMVDMGVLSEAAG